MTGRMLTIWTNAAFPEGVAKRLEGALAGYRVVKPGKLEAVNLVAGEPHEGFMEAEVAFGQPDVGQVMESKKIRWVHLTSAGYTRYDREDLRESCRRRGVVVTNSSHVYDEPCAQHVLAMMMAMGRQLPGAWVDQGGKREWPSAELRAASRLMIGEKVLIYGFGTIARRLVELLTPLRMEITGVRRRPSGDEGVRIVTDGDEVLGEADHVVNILPANDATGGYFDGKRFGKMKKGVLFYNIGRGTTV
ncbi:MAG TPA: NAD(P)-dependent oxidoreductase, partial [Tepidisphaeraceae bacterium]|nr:NAD(P)-dependent oxidoreductase [Tepidisphaeraceae bacterium]